MSCKAAWPSCPWGPKLLSAGHVLRPGAGVRVPRAGCPLALEAQALEEAGGQ